MIRPALLAAAWATLIAVTLPVSPSKAETLAGPFRARVLKVLDGDTFVAEIRLWFGQNVVEHVRVAGIEAPESGRRARCAQEAESAQRSRQYLSGLIGQQAVELREVRREKYGRTLATVRVNGIEVAPQMTEMGYARPYAGKSRQSWCP